MNCFEIGTINVIDVNWYIYTCACGIACADRLLQRSPRRQSTPTKRTSKTPGDMWLPCLTLKRGTAGRGEARRTLGYDINNVYVLYVRVCAYLQWQRRRRQRRPRSGWQLHKRWSLHADVQRLRFRNGYVPLSAPVRCVEHRCAICVVLVCNVIIADSHLSHGATAILSLGIYVVWIGGYLLIYP